MNKLHKYLSLSIVFIFILFYSSVVQAASFSVSASSNTLNVGKTTTLKIKATDCGGKFTISSSDSSIVSVSSSSEWIESSSKSITLTAKKSGKATITVKAYDVANVSGESAVTGSKSVTITVKDVNSNNNNNNNNSNNNPTTPSGTTQEPTFTAVNETIYAKSKANVRSSYSTSSSIVGSLKVGDSLTRIGISSNGWSKVTYNGKTAYVSSSLLTKTKPEEEKPEENKPEPQEDTKLTLDTLNIEGYVLTPEFSKDIYEYSLNIKDDVEKLEIEAISSDKNVTIDIQGNENLNVGENKITITITKEKSKEKAIYTINAIKEDTKTQEVVEENVVINQDLLNEEIERVNKELQIKKWIIIGIIVFVTAVIIIMFILRYFTKEDDEYYDEEEEYINIKEKFNKLNDVVSFDNKNIEQEENINLDNEEENNIQEDTYEEYEEEPNKKRKPKGKHF